MIPSRTEPATHLGRPAGTLSELKCRVADAVATETGKAAVKDLLAVAPTGRPEPARTADRYHGPDPDGYRVDDDPADPGPQLPPASARPDWPAAARVASPAAMAWGGWPGERRGGLTAGRGGRPGRQSAPPHAGLALAVTVADLSPHLAALPF